MEDRPPAILGIDFVECLRQSVIFLLAGGVGKEVALPIRIRFETEEQHAGLFVAPPSANFLYSSKLLSVKCPPLVKSPTAARTKRFFIAMLPSIV